jgi:hyperpolarization activated cyclic nucleotide-gated potassium channel 1
MFRVLASLMTVLICLHLASCFWYFSAKLDGFGPETWVVRYGYMDDSDGDKYMAAFYWALTTLSTVGYGDIGAETDVERILCMIWMTFGVIFFSFTVGNLTSMLSSIDTKETILTNKILVIEEFCKEAKLSKDLRLRLKHAIKYSTERVGFSWSDKQHIFNELPRSLRYEVSLAMY